MGRIVKQEEVSYNYEVITPAIFQCSCGQKCELLFSLVPWTCPCGRRYDCRGRRV